MSIPATRRVSRPVLRTTASRPATHRAAVPAVAALLLALTGCSAPAAGLPAEATALLDEYGVEADSLDSVEEVVEVLDATHEDRHRGLAGSVTADQVLLAGQGGQGDQVALDVPEDRFYLAVAPYETTTHDCFHHSLSGCQGELVDTPVRITVTDPDGVILVDEERTTYANGFVGLWLPAGIEATLEVQANGKSATTPIATGAQDPTCLTGLRLT